MKLEVGDTVKISRNTERFWVIIHSIDNDHITAKVDNDVITQPFHRGDIIDINENEICALYINDHQIGY